MKLGVTGFIYFLKLSLLLRGIFASSLEDEECTESEDPDYTDENSIIFRTSNERYTQTATSIVYVYSPQTSFNSLMGLGHPTTILIASTLIEILTITPALAYAKQSYMLSDKETTDVPTISNKPLSQIISRCSGCSTIANNSQNNNTKTNEPISKSENSYPSVTSHGSSTTVSSAGITSIKFHSTSPSSHTSPTSSNYKSVTSEESLSRTRLTYSCDASLCLSTDFTNSTTRNVNALSWASQKSTKSPKNKTEATSKDKNDKTSYIKASMTSTFVATTSYHYYDSAGIKQSLDAPIFLALFLLDIISF